MKLAAHRIHQARLAGKAGLLALVVSAVGCTVNPVPAFHEVDDIVYQRTGHRIRWNQGTEEDRQVGEAVHRLLSHELTPDAAVEIALLNNHDLQATFERIGIAQADLVQAGLLRNPEFAASWRFPDRAPRQTDADYAISQDFLDLLILPLRKKVAAAQLERTQQMVADAVLKLTADVKTAYYTVQAQQQLIDRLKIIEDINRTAAELAEKQHAAGNVNDLDLANQQTLFSQSTLEVTQARITLTAHRERLNRLMGLGGTDTLWTVVKQLPEIPAGEVPLEHLEALAIRQRLDLAASRRSVQALAESLGITENFRYLTTVKIGVDTEHNPGGPNVTGPTLDLELPIFDQGQARIAVSQSQYRQARQELLQLAINVRSEVREARERLTAQRDLALYYGKILLPQRVNIVNLTQLHYNAMLKGTYDLLLAKQNELAAERAFVEAWRDYWIARAQLERAVGGRLIEETPAPAPATQPSSHPAEPPAPSDHPHTHMNGDQP